MSKHTRYFNSNDETFSLRALTGYSDAVTLLRSHIFAVVSKERSFEDTFDIIKSNSGPNKEGLARIATVSILECFEMFKRLGLCRDRFEGGYQCVHFKMQVNAEEGIDVFDKHYDQGEHSWLVIYCPWLGSEIKPDVLYKEVDPGFAGSFEWKDVRALLGDYILNEGIYDDVIVSTMPSPDKPKPTDWDERPIAFSVLNIKLAVVDTSAALNRDTFKEVLESLKQLSVKVAQFVQDTIHTKNFYVESFWRDRGLVVVSHLPNSKNTPVFR